MRRDATISELIIYAIPSSQVAIWSPVLVTVSKSSYEPLSLGASDRISDSNYDPLAPRDSGRSSN